MLTDSWNPRPTFYKGGASYRNFPNKGGSDFSHTKGGVGKKGEGALSLIFILTNPFQSYLSLSEW